MHDFFFFCLIQKYANSYTNKNKALSSQPFQHSFTSVVIIYFLGGIPGAGHAGCVGFGSSGLCQAADWKWSQHASLSHAFQAGGALQHGNHISTQRLQFVSTELEILHVFELHFFSFLFLRDMVPLTRCITWSEMSKRYELCGRSDTPLACHFWIGVSSIFDPIDVPLLLAVLVYLFWVLGFFFAGFFVLLFVVCHAVNCK